MTADPFAGLAHAVVFDGMFVLLDGIRYGGHPTRCCLWLGLYDQDGEMVELLPVACAYHDAELLLLVPYWREFARQLSDPLIALAHLP